MRKKIFLSILVLSSLLASVANAGALKCPCWTDQTSEYVAQPERSIDLVQAIRLATSSQESNETLLGMINAGLDSLQSDSLPKVRLTIFARSPKNTISGENTIYVATSEKVARFDKMKVTDGHKLLVALLTYFSDPTPSQGVRAGFAIGSIYFSYDKVNLSNSNHLMPVGPWSGANPFDELLP